MNDNDFEAEHDWTFQHEKLLHESKLQDYIVTFYIMLPGAFLFLAGLHWVGVI